MKTVREIWSYWGHHASFFSEKTITYATLYSKQVKTGDLFVALACPNQKLHINQAITQGAQALLIEDPNPRPVIHEHIGIPHLIIPNLKSTLQDFASFFYGPIDSKVQTIAITGTNGKTSTAFFIADMAKHLELKAGVVGTLGYCKFEQGLQNHWQAVRLTTPDILSIYRAYHHMKPLDLLILEASSHALDQNRLGGLKINAGVLTQITQDHLDYHHNMANYVQAKQKLFEKQLSLAVLNTNCPYSKTFSKKTPAQKTVYYDSNNIENNDLPTTIMPMLSELWRNRNIAFFQKANAVAALTTLQGLGHDLCNLQHWHMPKVPGRFEQLNFPRCPKIVIDYAHTPGALLSLLQSARALTESKLYVLFGCGGNRDSIKRAQMGAIAEQGADHMILTSDNARNEDPKSIIQDIQSGMKYPEKVTIIVDRQHAIQWALKHMQPNDCLVLAGKGHETCMIENNTTTTFDEKSIINNFIKKRRHIRI